MPENLFGEAVAASYDEDSADMFQPSVLDPTVEFLAELAGDGAALELGIGTGRIALPLARRGIPVHGIDLSQAMVARLRAKPGGQQIPVAIGDLATTRVDGTFSVAYLVFNTIMNLTTQEAQVACFGNAAAHLEPGGCFVVELRVPQLRRLPPGHYLEVADGRGEYSTIPFRYVWPAELDLMARLAGMTLRERWGGWRREPFTGESVKHVSVWEKPG